MYTVLHVKYQLFLSGFNETSIFENCPTVKFHENLSSGSRVGSYGGTDR